MRISIVYVLVTIYPPFFISLEFRINSDEVTFNLLDGNNGGFEDWKDKFLRNQQSISHFPWRVVQISTNSSNIFSSQIYKEIHQIFVFLPQKDAFNWSKPSMKSIPLYKSGTTLIFLNIGPIDVYTKGIPSPYVRISTIYILHLQENMTNILAATILCPLCNHLISNANEIMHHVSVSNMFIHQNITGKMQNLNLKYVRVYCKNCVKHPLQLIRYCKYRQYLRFCAAEYKFMSVISEHLNFTPVYPKYFENRKLVAIIFIDSYHYGNYTVFGSFQYLRDNVFLNFAYCQTSLERKISSIIFWLSPFDNWTLYLLLPTLTILRFYKLIFKLNCFRNVGSKTKEVIIKIGQILSAIMILTIAFQYKSFMRSYLTIPPPIKTISSLTELVIDKGYKVMLQIDENPEAKQLFLFAQSLFEAKGITKEDLINKYLIPQNISFESYSDYFGSGKGTQLTLDVFSLGFFKPFNASKDQQENRCKLIDDEVRSLRVSYYFFDYASRILYKVSSRLESAGIIRYWYKWDHFYISLSHRKEEIWTYEQEFMPIPLGMKDTRVKSIFAIWSLASFAIFILIAEIWKTSWKFVEWIT